MNNEAKREGTRLSKKVSMISKFSRNEAEKLINAGKVFVNGEMIKSATKFVLDSDKVEVRGEKMIPSKLSSETKILALHKPRGLVVTRSDEKARKTIYSILPPTFSNFIYIGRLDIQSEGLLLLTNNGELAHEMELPAHCYEREYEVSVFGIVSDDKINRMMKGVSIDSLLYKAKSVEVKKRKTDDSKNTWISVVLTGGKNREIRKLMEFFNLKVNRLIRVRYGTVSIGALPVGAYMELHRTKVAKILENAKKLQ